jgi:hypothetical protein
VARALLLLITASFAAASAAPQAEPPTAASQLPRVGEINFYGLQKITPERILNALNLRSGGPLPPSKGEMEDTLTNLPGVVLARVEAICCESSHVTVFIGIEEKGAPHPAFRSDPAGESSLPPELVESYRQYLVAVARAAGQGTAGEYLTAGHSLMRDPGARAFQLRFLSFAEANVPLLRQVLRTSPESEQRAIAATVIGYAPKKTDVLPDLQYALTDPDESVRQNALRALKAIAVLAGRERSLGIRISPTWLVELLNSVVLSDRVEAVSVLLVLADNGDTAALDLVRERALPALAEMARWPSLRYALPPYMLLGRVEGIKEQELQQLWEKGEREKVIEKALAPAAHKRD